ncbi:MAG: DegT/DnrJ/EryC1/StrS family aminotransferase, partial [Cyclobacteriaceae bacterium]
YLSTQAKLNFHHYEHRELGFNYKMNNLTAGIGIAQLASLEEKLAKRRQIHQYYHTYLSPLPGITFLDEPEDYFSNRWLTTILIDPQLAGFDANVLREALLTREIESRFLWKPMHLQPLYKNALYYGGNNAMALFHQGLCLPSGSGLTDAGLNRVIDCIFEIHACMLMRTEKSM